MARVNSLKKVRRLGRKDQERHRAAITIDNVSRTVASDARPACLYALVGD
jgi:hypothetical protein